MISTYMASRNKSTLYKMKMMTMRHWMTVSKIGGQVLLALALVLATVKMTAMTYQNLEALVLKREKHNLKQ